MDNKELNMAIYSQMAEVAKSVFEMLQNENQGILPGNYTASEIEKQFEVSGKMKECRRHVDNGRFLNEVQRDEYYKELECLGYWGESVSFGYGEFRCSIIRCSIFAKMAQWESMARIPAKNKVIFTKEEETEAIGSCTLVIPKESKILAEYASKDYIRPNLCSVLVDVENGNAVASDTHVLGIYGVEISDIDGQISKCWIDPKTWKKIAGKRVRIEIIKDVKIAKIITEKNEIFQCEQFSNFPDYFRVLPSVSKEGFFQVADTKKIREFAKSLLKKSQPVIRITLPAYSSKGTMEWEDSIDETAKRIEFEVCGTSKINIRFGIGARQLYQVADDWNGVVWYSSSARPLIFDNDNGKCTVSMPMNIINEKDEFAADEIKNCNVPALRRKEYEIALSEIEVKKTEKQKESGIAPKSEQYPLAVCSAPAINFAEMLQAAKDEIERNAIWETFFENMETESIISSIIEIMAIIEELTAIVNMSQNSRSGASDYIEADITDLYYTREAYSCRDYVEFSDDCQDWIQTGNNEINWDSPCGIVADSLIETDWEGEIWNTEYSKPVNMEIVIKFVDLASELSKLGTVIEMCAKAKEIESLGMSAGITPAEDPEIETVSEDIKEGPDNDQTDSFIPETTSYDKRIKTEHSEPYFEPMSVTLGSADSKESAIMGIGRRISNRLRKISAVFF